MLIELNSKQRAPGPKSRDSFHSVLGQGHVLFSQGLTVTHNAKRGHMDISSSRLFQSPEVGVTLFVSGSESRHVPEKAVYHGNGPLASRSSVGLGKNENLEEGRCSKSPKPCLGPCLQKDRRSGCSGDPKAAGTP
jgi:hypothetical protein